MMDKPQEENCLTPLPQEAQFDGNFWRQVLLGVLLVIGLAWWVTSTPRGREWSGCKEPPPVAALSLWQPPKPIQFWHPPLSRRLMAILTSSVQPGPLPIDVEFGAGMISPGSGTVYLHACATTWAPDPAHAFMLGAIDASGYPVGEEIPCPSAITSTQFNLDYSGQTSGGYAIWASTLADPTAEVQWGSHVTTFTGSSAMIRIGSSASDSLLWDTGTEHRFSKYGSDHGGYKDVSTATTGKVRSVPFQYVAPVGSTYKALLKLDGHTWETVTGLAGIETGSGNFVSLPYSAGGADPWETYLGAAGSKTLTVELYRESDNVKVAEDTGAYTMFVPALVVTTDPVTTVPDRFDVSVAWNEWWADGGAPYALLTALVDAVEYDFGTASVGGYRQVTVTLNGTTAVVTHECDLAYLKTTGFVGSTFYGGDPCSGGPPDGAVTLRATPVYVDGNSLYQPEPMPPTDVGLLHAQTYVLDITAPTSGAELFPGSRAVTVYCSQGWYADSFVRLYAYRGGAWVQLAQQEWATRTTTISGTLVTGDTSLKAEWGYLSGTDWIVLATDTVAITVSADGGVAGGGEDSLPPPPVPENPPGTDPVYPPWVQWILPPSGATVTPTFTLQLAYGNFTATPTGHLVISATKGGVAVSLYNDTVVLAGTGTLALPLDFGAATDGEYFVNVLLTGPILEAASTIATLTLAAAGSADTTAPVVMLTAPLEGATISGDTVTLTATATDAGGVWRLTWLVDGAIIGYSFAPANATSYTATWELDSTLFLNGSHVISVVARDITGNVSDPDTATVNVANTQADLTRYLYTVPLGVDTDGNPLNTQSARFLNRNKTRTIEVPILPLVADLSADPRLRYNLYFGYDEGLTATPVWSDFTLYDPLKSHTIPESKTIRWGFCAVPQQTTASFDVTCASLTRLTLAENGDPLLLAITPHSLQQFSVASGSLSQLADLSALAETPVDVAACGGKVYVAHGAKVLVIDADTGELTDDLDPDFLTSKTAITALATDGTALYVAATLTAGGSRVYKYTPEATTLYASHDYAITALAYLGSTLYAGNAQGDVLTVTASGATLAYATGEASVARLAANGSAIYAGTGTAGKLFGKLATWGLQWDSGFTALAGLSSYNGYTWAAGTGTGARYLWYEQTAGTWAQGLDTDELVTAINDLLTLEDGGHEQLFIGATRSGGTCRLYRVEMAAPATYQCGVNVPPFLGKALK